MSNRQVKTDLEMKEDRIKQLEELLIENDVKFFWQGGAIHINALDFQTYKRFAKYITMVPCGEVVEAPVKKEVLTVRHIDDRGMVLIPKFLRAALELKTGDGVEMWLDGEILKVKKCYNAEDML